MQRKLIMLVAKRAVATRTNRMICIGLVGTAFVALLVREAQRDTLILPTHAPGAIWAWYAAYSFLGLLFFGVGALVWLYSYARRPVVATLLFCFCGLIT